MRFVEEARLFWVADKRLLGIVARPHVSGDCAVLVIVGGPQYRVGSHRQFLLLSRVLAAEGYPTMRFDYRGIGDSEGDIRDFSVVSDDVSAAIDTLLSSCPGVNRVVLWGLCDAASAALLYVQGTNDLRVSGLVLLNPWVRSETSLAKTHIKHYYGQRLLQWGFWKKLLGGRMHPLESARGFLESVLWARGTIEDTSQRCAFQDRMADGLRQFRGEVLLILSGRDYTAKEFLEFIGSNKSWSGLLGAPKITRVDVPDADHTFSRSELRSVVEANTLSWLATHFR